MTIYTLEFPKKFQKQFIFYEHLLWPAIIGLDFSHNYLIGTDWCSSNQFYPHQGPKSIIILDPAPFPLHINQISTLPSPHILIKTVLQVTIPPRTLAIVPATLSSIPKPNSHYSFMELSVPYESKQNAFVVPVLNIFSRNYQYTYMCNYKYRFWWCYSAYKLISQWNETDQ